MSKYSPEIKIKACEDYLSFATDVPTEYPIPINKRIQKYKEKWCA